MPEVALEAKTQLVFANPHFSANAASSFLDVGPKLENQFVLYAVSKYGDHSSMEGISGRVTKNLNFVRSTVIAQSHNVSILVVTWHRIWKGIFCRVAV